MFSDWSSSLFLSLVSTLCLSSGTLTVCGIDILGKLCLLCTVPAYPCVPVCLQRNLTEYFVAVDVNNMLQLYASMLHERRIIITSTKLSTVSPFPSCHSLSCSYQRYPVRQKGNWRLDNLSHVGANWRMIFLKFLWKLWWFSFFFQF